MENTRCYGVWFFCFFFCLFFFVFLLFVDDFLFSPFPIVPTLNSASSLVTSWPGAPTKRMAMVMEEEEALVGDGTLKTVEAEVEEETLEAAEDTVAGEVALVEGAVLVEAAALVGVEEAALEVALEVAEVEKAPLAVEDLPPSFSSLFVFLFFPLCKKNFF